MKRELKFKYYFKIQNRDGFEVNEIALTMSEIQKRIFTGKDEDCIAIMQFTGLKDKNGIEIFEGDIVKVNKDEIGSVGFNRGNFWVGFFQEPAQQNLSDFVSYNMKTDSYDKVDIEITGKLAYLTKV